MLKQIKPAYQKYNHEKHDDDEYLDFVVLGLPLLLSYQLWKGLRRHRQLLENDL